MIFRIDFYLTVKEVINLNITLRDRNILSDIKKEFTKKEFKIKKEKG